MITIIDYGMGNLGSIQNMFKKLKIESLTTSDLNEVQKAKKLLLPGVGAFDSAMQRIHASGLKAVLDRKVIVDKTPILGICLGMQLLINSSEEGIMEGLGWIPGKASRFLFPTGESLKIPHMGWNYVHEVRSSPLTAHLPDASRFYFVHSFYVKVIDPRHVVMRTHYGVDFDSVIQLDNIYGAQFHPEKSHKFGMRLLDNFAAL
ncbi:imidazole glycerol phosphate synthase subunit HisH [bacterium]|nr:imidazole glycerol phosphate synthase subunit HisH [bacterium]